MHDYLNQFSNHHYRFLRRAPPGFELDVEPRDIRFREPRPLMPRGWPLVAIALVLLVAVVQVIKAMP